LNNPDGEVLGTLEVENTGSWQRWTTVKGKMKNTQGVHDICLVFKGGEGDLFHFDWWKLN